MSIFIFIVGIGCCGFIMFLNMLCEYFNIFSLFEFFGMLIDFLINCFLVMFVFGLVGVFVFWIFVFEVIFFIGFLLINWIELFEFFYFCDVFVS